MKDNLLGQKMLNYRAKHGLSQVKLAQICNVTTQTICNVENGVQNPSKLTRQKILNVIEEDE